MIAKFEVFPQGLTIGPGQFRPVMIFKDKAEAEILPVWLDPVDAGLLLAEANVQVPSRTGHRSSLRIIAAFGIKLTSLYFDEVSGPNQFATLTAVQDKKIVTSRVRAAEAVSLAINAGCLFFTNAQIVEKSRCLNMDWLMQGSAGQQGEKRREALH